MTKAISEITEEIIEIIVVENLARAKANEAEPYVHADYEVHSQRIHRLVDLIADGDADLADAYYEALFDITYDGVKWAKDTFAAIQREHATEMVFAAEVTVGTVLAGQPFEGEVVTKVHSYDERTVIHTEFWAYETMGEEMVTVYR